MKRIFYLLLIVHLPLQAQEFFSVHQYELERHKNTPTTQALIGDPGRPILPLKQAAKKTGSGMMVFGYLPYWIDPDDYRYFRYENLTHIAAFGVAVNADGSLGNDRGWPWVNLINTAHSNGVKVILTATLFDDAAILTLISSRSNRERFFSNIKSKILAGNADGVNIDFEGSGSNGWPAQINDFMAELTDYLHREIPGSEVSFAAPAVNWGNRFDLSGLAASCDYLFIMGYAFSGSWSTVTGANAPLTGGSVNITTTVTRDYGAVTRDMPEKLILGVPYYGHHWKTASSSPGASVSAFVGPVFFFSAQPEAETRGKLWHSPSQTPWYRYDDGDSWHQVWFDDDSSLGLKYDLAIQHEYGGVGMWALGYDGSRPELWEVLERKIGTRQDLPPLRPEAVAVLSRQPNSLEITFEAARRAEGYYVYWGSEPGSVSDSVFFAETRGTLTGLENDRMYFVHVRAMNQAGLSPATQSLPARTGAVPSPILLLDGFDRRRNEGNAEEFLLRHAQAVHGNGLAFSSANNDALTRGLISLRSFRMVDWVLGDESTADETFSAAEQDSVEGFLQAGGRLFVSGSEVGWDLVENGTISDQVFYRDFLKARYVDDAPQGRQGRYYTLQPVAGSFLETVGTFSFDDGSRGSYDVDWPDAIEATMGSSLILRFDGLAEGAGVAFSGRFPGGKTAGRLVYLSVPFETIYPDEKRLQVMAAVLDYFDIAPVGSIEDAEFLVQQNFPNPFTQATEVRYRIQTPGAVKITVFDLLGRELLSDERRHAEQGWFVWQWDGRDAHGRPVASGRYFILLDFTGATGQVLQRRLSLTRLR